LKGFKRKREKSGYVEKDSLNWRASRKQREKTPKKRGDPIKGGMLPLLPGREKNRGGGMSEHWNKAKEMTKGKVEGSSINGKRGERTLE